MALVSKYDDQPAVSLVLVKPASGDPTTAPVNLTPTPESGDQTSRAALMQMIYELLLLIGENMSKAQVANSKIQMNEADLAKAQVDAAKANVDQVNKAIEKLHHQQEEAKKWGIFGTIMKWIGVALALVVGALLCETGVGFAILALTVAFMASPLFDMAVKGIADLLVKAGVPQSWANIIAQVIILVVVVVASFGTEAATAGMRFGIQAAEDVGETAVQDTMKAVEQEIEEEVEEEGAIEMQDLSEEASSKSTSSTENTGSETTESTKSQARFTSATTQAFLQVLMSSNLIPELIGKIPGIKKYPWLVQLLSVLVEIVIALAAFKVTPTTGAANGLEQLSGLTKLSPAVLKAITASIATLVTVFADIAAIGTGLNQKKQAQIGRELATPQAALLFEEGIMQILTQITSQNQTAFNQTMKAQEAIFKVDFSADMKACVAAQQYQA